MGSILNRPIAILGSNGQVGRALIQLLGERSVGFSRQQADLADSAQVVEALTRLNPSAVINAAAYTQVDKAESEPELAYAINAVAPGAVALWCAERDTPFLHYSTDYVFSGEGILPWKESDPTAPVSTYGRTKLEGEKNIATAGGQWLVFRTSWVYEAHGKNFLTTMLRLGKDREELKVVADQVGAPTYALHLATATVKALDLGLQKDEFPSSIYHLAGAGETTWCEFTNQIFNVAKTRGIDLAVRQVIPIPSVEYPTPAKRPFNSRLDCSLAKQTFGIEMPHWQVGLEECMNIIVAEQ